MTKYCSGVSFTLTLGNSQSTLSSSNKPPQTNIPYNQRPYNCKPSFLCHLQCPNITTIMRNLPSTPTHNIANKPTPPLTAPPTTSHNPTLISAPTLQPSPPKSTLNLLNPPTKPFICPTCSHTNQHSTSLAISHPNSSHPAAVCKICFADFERRERDFRHRAELTSFPRLLELEECVQDSGQEEGRVGVDMNISKEEESRAGIGTGTRMGMGARMGMLGGVYGSLGWALGIGMRIFKEGRKRRGSESSEGSDQERRTEGNGDVMSRVSLGECASTYRQGIVLTYPPMHATKKAAKKNYQAQSYEANYEHTRKPSICY
ncbi:uncharacterized protein BDR25DRAFT_356543 [Lindgomyces ingoldianus]|uniref:Uncharacterized protein n=1 Tax=Lindgomyces ingoldianus TaxID=673940 RepID=A0ACB6QQW2_9PLEO|nr:uncharacterized protein BDR25DRAFT_356543 [Lindgomyces ingoldianus]KAF2469301.1 hypothetical protein BDR25DRAFT_356543 [Lindgomyces ingoldianus]